MPKSQNLGGTNSSQGSGKHESLLARALWALPFLAITAAAATLMDVTISLPWGEKIVGSGVVVEAGGIPIRKTFYGVEGLDGFIAVVNTFFFPSVYGFDLVSRRQTLSFLVDASVIIATSLLESTRRTNNLAVILIPTFFLLLAQAFGAGLVFPVYFSLHYVFSPIERFSAPSRRLMPVNVARAIVPAIALGHLIPMGLTYFHPDLSFRQTALFVWQLYPLYTSAALYLLSKLTSDTTANDKAHASTRDLPYVRFAVGAFVATSSIVWVANWATSPVSLVEMFVPQVNPQNATGLTPFAAAFLQWDETFSFSAGFLWLAFLFGDMKRAGMQEAGWVRLVLPALIGVVALGPGATFGLGWLWKEEVLAMKKHKRV